MVQHSWTACAYSRRGGFVPDFGKPVVYLLEPQGPRLRDEQRRWTVESVRLRFAARVPRLEAVD